MNFNKRLIILLSILLVLVFGTLGGIYFYWTRYSRPIARNVLTEKEHLRVAALMEPIGIYPEPFGDVSEIISHAVNSQVFEPLVTLDNDFKLKPVLAESWDNPDNLTWRIYLKKNVKFHNGDSFTAEDVKATLEASKKDKWVQAQDLDQVSEIKVVNPYTIELKTKSPYPILMNKLSFFFILPKSVIAEGKVTEKHIGTGAFKFVKYEQGKELVFERNDNWWSEKPKVKKVTYKYLSDPEEAAKMIKDGEADAMESVNPALAKEANKDSKLKNSIKFLDYGVKYIGLSVYQEKSPYIETEKNPFKDKRVREAIALGINLDEMMQEAILGDGETASQMVPKDIFGYNPSIQQTAYNPERAKSLLKEAGYPNGFTVTMDIPVPREADGQALVKQLKNIGITLKLALMDDPATGMKKLSQKDTGMYFMGFGCDSGDGSELFEQLAYSKSDYNYTGYNNSEVDRLTDLAKTTVDQSKRREYLQEAMTALKEDYVYIPLYANKFTYFASLKINLVYDKSGEVKATLVSGVETVYEKQSYKQFIVSLFSS
ncbi:MAG: ABC transporter substrate-binding protein [Patescibacteria group bacterium]|nr:ABC transporter substrate-binding protein [Patescibacteria group bacterium]